MACPDGWIKACDFPQFFVSQTPKFDQIIMEDIRPTDGWLLNVSTGTVPMGTPPEITQDRFRSVWPNITKQWSRVLNPGVGCIGNPCDPPEYRIGWGADRLTYFALEQTWATPLLCYNQDMHVTHAVEHIAQIINSILRPATTIISSALLRKVAIYWAGKKFAANARMDEFTYQWSVADTDGDGVADEEIYFDCSVPPSRIFHLVPQMLQRRFMPLMQKGYAGKNPFKETTPFIELVTDIDTCWFLDKLGGSAAVTADVTPNVAANWRFIEWGAANKYWRYGFSGQLGNFMIRVDPFGLRFNYVTDLGPSAHGGNGNRYRYQIVLPYVNNITTGAGGAAGIGADENPDYQDAEFAISIIWHKRAMELLVPDATPIHPDMPYGHRDFGGKWRFLMHDLGADVDGKPIKNDWENKGRFGAWFKYYPRPLYTEFAEVLLHKREPMIVPEIDRCTPSPGYPAQRYSSELPECPLPTDYQGQWGTGVPSGDNAGPLNR